jgi:hypothetical protein
LTQCKEFCAAVSSLREKAECKFRKLLAKLASSIRARQRFTGACRPISRREVHQRL